MIITEKHVLHMYSLLTQIGSCRPGFVNFSPSTISEINNLIREILLYQSNKLIEVKNE